MIISTSSRSDAMKQHRNQPLDFEMLKTKQTPIWQVVLLSAAFFVVIYLAGSEMFNLLITQSAINP